MRLAIAFVCLAACSGETPDATGPDAGLDAAIDPTPTAAALLDRIAACDQVVGGTYAEGGGLPETVDICGLPNAVFWKADMDIDCDGQMSVQCNSMTDPYYQPQTAAVDSSGEYLDAATLPFVVIPGRGERFDYRAAGLAMGSVVVVIYGDKLEWGVLGDVGPVAYIGEASYRMAELLGIDPDPATGGAETGVSYIAFTGESAVVDVIEDHAAAVELGTQKALALLGP